jgi:hypothetical protein
LSESLWLLSKVKSRDETRQPNCPKAEIPPLLSQTELSILIPPLTGTRRKYSPNEIIGQMIEDDDEG